MAQLGSVLAIIVLVIAIMFIFSFIVFHSTSEDQYVKKEKRILKAYQKGNLCPLLRYAKENTSLFTYDMPAEEELNILFLMKLQALNNTIPKEYETLDQKKAWLLIVKYNDCYLALSECVRNDTIKYTAFPDGALQEILNNETLMEVFASKYYNDKKEAVGKKSCIAIFARDGSKLAKEIVEKAQELWDKHHAEKEVN